MYHLHVAGGRSHVYTCTGGHVDVHVHVVHNYLHTGWTMTPSPVNVAPCSAPVGPTVPISRDPLEMFSHYFDNDIIDLVVRETNRFAALANTGTTWETGAEEIRAYLGFHILMGINRLPEIRDYWARDPKMHYSPIASKISRKRFEEISRYLHFVDNAALPPRDEPGYHRLQKVLPLITALRERFKTTYNPHVQNSIDEAMIPFKGTIYTTLPVHNLPSCTCIYLYRVRVCLYYIYIHKCTCIHLYLQAGRP